MAEVRRKVLCMPKSSIMLRHSAYINPIKVVQEILGVTRAV